MTLEQLLAAKSKSKSESESESEHGTGCFDCNICLETVHNPVVTLCGHLFCWPCIYKWIRFKSAENNKPSEPSCPVCKSEVTEASLVPLYGRGNTAPSGPTAAKPASKAGLGIVVPRRPNFCGLDSPRASPGSPYRGSPRRAGPGGIPASLLETTMGLYGEAVYARVFGDSITNLYTYPNSYNLAGNASPRVRRHVMEADRSLGRVCFFLSCCLVLCLLLF